MNRADRRALARHKPGRAKPAPRLHQALLLSDILPLPSAGSVLTDKIKLLEGIAALKDGRFGYDQLCQFHDFVSLGLRFCDQFKDERLREPINAVALAMTGIIDRYNDRGIYAATGDELRTLQGSMEEIADYLGTFPAVALDALRFDLAQEELEIRARIAGHKLARA